MYRVLIELSKNNPDIAAHFTDPESDLASLANLRQSHVTGKALQFSNMKI